MGNVANEMAANGIQGFLTKLYKPICVWAKNILATKTELAAATQQASVATCEAIVDELT